MKSSTRYFCLNFVLALGLVSYVLGSTGEYTCTKKFCKYYLDQNDCTPLGLACDEQNMTATFNGETYSDAVPCGCCSICLQNINEGDFCTIGSVALTPPYLVCGSELSCQQNKTLYTCEKDYKEFPCFESQQNYEQNKLQFIEKPVCNGDGQFFPLKCNVNQTCFCVNDDGHRIFGEVEYTHLQKYSTIACECSRFNEKVKILNDKLQLQMPYLTARCTDDGNYDPLQCFGELCTCVDPFSGFPTSSTFNMTALKNVYSPTTLPCFDYKIHFTYMYHHDCEFHKSNVIEAIEQAKTDGSKLLNFESKLKSYNCDPNGWYGPVAADGCVDKYGQAIGGTTGQTVGNCKCARTKEFVVKLKNRVNATEAEKGLFEPQCNPNGDFDAKQCRNGNLCYCVDENGVQIQEASTNSVSC